MTRDEVIAMARAAGFFLCSDPMDASEKDFLARFADIVADKAAADERESCAQIVEAPHWKPAVRHALAKRAEEIRARGEK